MNESLCMCYVLCASKFAVSPTHRCRPVRKLFLVSPSDAVRVCLWCAYCKQSVNEITTAPHLIAILNRTTSFRLHCIAHTHSERASSVTTTVVDTNICCCTGTQAIIAQTGATNAINNKMQYTSKNGRSCCCWCVSFGVTRTCSVLWSRHTCHVLRSFVFS